MAFEDGDRRQVAAGLVLAGVATVGQAAVFRQVAAGQAGDWVLYASPAFGLLGFAGLGLALTAFMDRG